MFVRGILENKVKWGYFACFGVQALEGLGHLTYPFSCLINVFLNFFFLISHTGNAVKGYCGIHNCAFVAHGDLKEADLSQTEPNSDCNM